MTAPFTGWHPFGKARPGVSAPRGEERNAYRNAPRLAPARVGVAGPPGHNAEPIGPMPDYA